jgi:hypothetical protein
MQARPSTVISKKKEESDGVSGKINEEQKKSFMMKLGGGTQEIKNDDKKNPISQRKGSDGAGETNIKK